MPIPENKLETWSHQGAVATSKNTYASIKGNLETFSVPYAGSFEIYLQGSYSNDTNTYADSDVDVVIQLNSAVSWATNRLPPDQAEACKKSFSPAAYQFSNFKSDILKHLNGKYGYQVVTPGNKSIKLRGENMRRNADIVVCCQYRDYNWFRDLSDQNFDEGIWFTSPDGKPIINYPKLHSQNCTKKHQSANSNFKPMVRIFKNMRALLVEDNIITADLAPSYFIEGLLYNIPDDKFSSDFGATFCTCMNWLNQNNRTKFVCPSRKHWLFGDSFIQWNSDKCSQFIQALINLWNGGQ